MSKENVSAMDDHPRFNVPGLIARFRRYGWGLVAPASTLVAIFLTNVLASRRLGPAAFGQFAVASSIIALLSVAVALGVPTVLVTLLGRQADGERVAQRSPQGDTSLDGSVREWRGAALATVWLSAGLVVAAVIAAELSLGRRIDRWFPHGTGLAIGMACIGTALLEVSLAESQRVLEFRAFFARMVGGAVYRLVGVAIALYAFAPTARSAIWGYALASFCSGVVLTAPSSLLAVRALRADARRLGRLVAHLMERSAPLFGSAIVVAATAWLDTIVMAGHMAAAEVGVYAAAVRLTIAPSTLIGGISALALPLAVEAWREGRVARYNVRVLRIGLVMGIAVVGALALGADTIVRVVYGSAFAAAGPVFTVLSLGYLASFPGNPMSQVLFAAGRARSLLVVQTLQLALTLVGLGLMLGHVGAREIAMLRATVNVAGTVVVMVMAARLDSHDLVVTEAA